MNNNKSSWPLFTYVIPGNETIFKGMDVKVFDIKYDQPCWYSENMETAKKYGKYVHEIKTTTEIKLINLTSQFFHMFLKDNLNLRFRGNNNNGIDINKLKLLLPLGLPDLNSQVQYIKNFIPNNHLNNCKPPQPQLEPYISVFDRHHRYSNSQYDLELIKTLAHIFGSEFDGYISPIDWPSCFHNGLFHNEICLFFPEKQFTKNKMIYSKLAYTNTQRGGIKNRQNTMMKFEIDEDDQRRMGTMNLTKEECNKVVEEMLNNWKYEGPRHYDEKGNLQVPTWEEAMADEKRKKELRYQESIKDSA